MGVLYKKGINEVGEGFGTSHGSEEEICFPRRVMMTLLQGQANDLTPPGKEMGDKLSYGNYGMRRGTD